LAAVIFIGRAEEDTQLLTVVEGGGVEQLRAAAVVRAGAQAHMAAGIRTGAAGDQVDRAARLNRAGEGGRRTLDDLDAVDEERVGHAEGAVAVAVGRERLEAAVVEVVSGHVIGRRRAVVGQAAAVFQRLADFLRADVLDEFRRDDLDRAREIEQRGVETRAGDGVGGLVAVVALGTHLEGGEHDGSLLLEWGGGGA